MKLRALFITLLLLAGASARASNEHLRCAELLTDRELATTIETNDFNVVRPLSEYQQEFGQAFWEELTRLLADGHWIDGGAGEARAMLEYLTYHTRGLPPREVRARVTAVGVVRPPLGKRVEELSSDIAAGRFRYLEGYIEKLETSELGPADLITDFFGALSYSEAPHVVLRKYLSVLKPGGTLYIVHHSSTRIHTRSGEKLSFPEWLEKRVGGITVEPIEFEVDPFSTEFRPRHVAYRIRRAGGPIIIPKLRYDRTLFQGPPPAMVFYER